MTRTQSAPETVVDPSLCAPETPVDPSLWAAEQAFCAFQRTEQVRAQVRAAQQSVAASFEKSADSHERAAKTYDQRKPQGKYWEHAARHREFAREDRLIAERLRRMAGD